MPGNNTFITIKKISDLLKTQPYGIFINRNRYFGIPFNLVYPNLLHSLLLSTKNNHFHMNLHKQHAILFGNHCF